MAIRIFQHYWHLHLAVLAVIEGVIFFFAPYAAAFLLFGREPWVDEMLGSMLPRGVVFAGVLFISMAAMGLYNSRQRSRLVGLIARVAASIIGGGMFITILFYIFPAQLLIGRGALLISLVIAFGGSVIARIVFDTLVDEDLFKRRVLVYGSGHRAASIARLRRRSDRRGFVVVGYVPADGDEGIDVPSAEKLPTNIDLLTLCERHRVDEIVVAMDDRRRHFPMDQLLECRLEGVEILELVTFLERETGKVRLDLLNPSWMIFSAGFGRGRIHDTMERAFDIVASLILLVVAAPLMVLTALAIKITEGPKATIFYRQVRVGQYGRPFRLLKFRSMREDAEKDGAQWASKNDSRVTTIGAIIRLTRIDELPQILNVLRGEMSFVGPRPERPEFVGQLEERIPYYRERHTIKPGITGWAQLCYPYGSSEQDAIEKLQYDLFYVKNHSLLFYLAILVQTVEVIVWRKGAR
ncbi:TIGR03013 family PEP-CTERM/XrtA system glycosyltransferase [Steroidobacter sp. S1-65]|uniref:TIGR03013 family PEP-CTERM/XrtA system glycosyltransferase n=1 Tax=Steroidobacter gossypii TaxID=2805490 RepID=A0ABS1WYY4_9GAMM|nr:TIGR03013 family XrtA/PEP-CTERM system glycosyltransferase [Steroidobacter gossypii]MBM0106190.1 TIGR03013 family PEP-CTERM/XrtA system glycosyltransferase [Steroidobacter gossypii]